MHDIRSFVIGAFLSSLLLKEQMISDRKASGGFEHKIAGLKMATFISSWCFCCCCYCTVPPPPKKKKKKKLAKLPGFFFHLPCEQRSLSVFTTKSFARLVCRIVGLFTSREKPLQQTVSHVNKPTTRQTSHTNDFVNAKSHAREKPLLEGYVSSKTCVKSAQNRSLSTEICFF